MSNFLMKDLLLMVKIILAGNYRVSNEKGNELSIDEVDSCYGKVTVANSDLHVSIPAAVLVQLGTFSYVVKNAKNFYNGLLGNPCPIYIRESIHALSISMSTR